MAGAVGQIFVELDLDSSRYLKSQQKLLQDATSTTTNIEQNFRNLGVKSAAEFDLLRAKISNSFNMIANSSKATADDILRAEKAKNDKIKALNDQQFGHQKSGLETLKGHYMAFSIAAVAAIGAISKAWAMAKEGAGFEEQQAMLDKLGIKYGTTADTIVAEMDRAAGFQIAKSELMSIALAGIAKGLNPEQLINLANAAETLGDAVGKDATTALRDLTEALETGRTKGLKNYLGTSLDLKEAFGDLESELTESEKAQAMYNMTMISAIKLQKEQGEAVESAADKISQIEKKFDDATLAASRFAKTVIVGIIDGFKATFLAGNDAGETLTNFADITKKSSGATRSFADSVAAETAEVKKSADTFEESNRKLKAALQLRKDNAQAAKDNKKAAEDEAKARAKSADEQSTALTVFWDNYDKELTDNALAVYDTIQKNKDAVISGADAMSLSVSKYYEEYDAELTRNALLVYETSQKNKQAEIDAAKQTADEKKKLAEQLPQMYRDVYEDIRNASTKHYDAEEQLIADLASKFSDAGMDQVTIATWVQKKLEDLDLKKKKSSKDWTDGAKAALIELKDQSTSWGEVSYAAVKTFADDASKAFGSNFRDIVKGDFDDIGEAWRGVWDNMLTTLGTKIGDMIVEAAANEILMMFTASWTADSSNILGIINKGWDLWNLISSGDGTGGVSGSTPVAGGYSGGSYAGMASGGPIPAGRPVWVGEKGPELLFPTAPGHVLSHEQSMAYASHNGGFIPGYAEGTATAAQLATAAWVKSLTGFGWSGIDWDSILFTPNNGTGVWIDPDGTLHDIRQATGGGFFGDLLGNTLFGMFGDDRGVWTLAAIAATYGAYATAAPAVGAATGGAGAGAGAGSAATAATYGSILWDAADWYSAAYSFIAGSAAASLKKSVISSLLGGILGGIFGGTDKPQFSFSGIDGDLSWLSEGMSSIAPKSTPFGFHARNGLDYVPYDGFRAVLHQGERVQTKEQAQSGAAPIIIHNHLYVDGKEIKGIIDKVVVERNRRGVTNTRIYQ